jgi:hypothetical protein
MRVRAQGVTAACLAAAITVLLSTMAGCGGGGGTGGGGNANNLAAGNWSILGTSTVTSGLIYTLGGSISQNGSKISGTMHVLGPCENPNSHDLNIAFTVTGEVNSNQFTLSLGPTVAGSVVRLELTGNGSSLQNLTGIFTVTGGCSTTDQGTATATLVPSINGNWAGKATSAGDPNGTVSLALTQQSTADHFGTYALTALLNYSTNYQSCRSLPNTQATGYVAGSIVLLDIREDPGQPYGFHFFGSRGFPLNSVLSGDFSVAQRDPAFCGDTGTMELDFSP